MIQIKLYTKEAGLMTDVGTLEFYGIPVTKPDGSTWIEFGSLGKPRTGQVRLVPAGVARVSEIRTISEALSRNEIRGTAGRYEWRVE
jgi:hypothetical protein